MAPAGQSRVSPTQWVLVIILVGTVARLALAGATGLGYDESYMVGNARQFMASYVDHPPLHVWTVWAAIKILGSESAFAVRLPFVLLFAGSTWLMYRLTARLFGDRAGLWAALAFNLAPVFSLADGTWVLPDGPLIFLLLAAVLVVARIVFDERPGETTVLWIVAGALGGLALLSKLTAAFFFVGVLLYLLTKRDGRRQLATIGPWLGLAAALLVVSPALVWNIQNDFVGVTFQSGRMWNPGIRLDTFLVSVGGQLAYLTPWLAVPFLISLLRALRSGPSQPRGWYLALLAVGPIAAFSIAALFFRALPHWAMPGWLFTVPLFGRETMTLLAQRPKFARAYMAVAAAIFASLVGAFAWQATRGGLIPQSAIAQNPGIDPTIDLVDWNALPQALSGNDLTGPDLVVAATSWMYAGKASYALGPAVPVLCLCANPQQFGFRSDQRSYAGRDVLVVLPRGQGRDTAAAFFDRLEPLPAITVKRAGEPVLELDLGLGKDLRFP